MEIASALEDCGLAMRLAFDAGSMPEVVELLGEGAPGNLAGLAAWRGVEGAAAQVPVWGVWTVVGLVAVTLLLRGLTPMNEVPAAD